MDDLSNFDIRKFGATTDAPQGAQRLATHVIQRSPEDRRLVAALQHTYSHTTPLLSHASLTPTRRKQTTRPTPKPKLSHELVDAKESRLKELQRSWRYFWQSGQLACAFEAAARQGGIAFSLNLSPSRDAFLLGHVRPVDAMRREIERYMRKELGEVLPFGFAFEIAPSTGNVHLHGTIIPGTHDRKVIRKALARAAGHFTGKKAPRQVKLKDLFDGLGWAEYSQKDFDTACGFLQTNKITFISTSLKKSAKETHLSLRSAIRAK